ncbi:ABC transporter permease [Thermasporomyces composti]|uniref:Transport permease protein n=1 Tax=Thermasporomyces composti TaxID=696763 RepID=A0A3D9VA99_THECX|nr:ABC transporter permease [Thermasporomyces composti]REF35074.1 lipooligosaccharide transport system permease protein [Thermasporomyces composti]
MSPRRKERNGVGVDSGPERARTGRLRATERAFEYWMLAYRRTWRGTAVSTFLMPVLFLAALGLGLGSFVDTGPGRAALGGQTYLTFIAPGLLAATAMQTAALESSYPVMGAWKWFKSYYAMLATPLRPVDVLVGHLLFVGFRVLTTCLVYLVVISAFGAVRSPWGVLTVVAGLLTGLAVAAPTFALATIADRDTVLSIYFRLAILPMFLFSGAFFPVEQLPALVRLVAYATPLWHGVEMARMFAYGIPEPGRIVLGVGYLCTWVGAGTWWAAHAFRRRLFV